MSTSILKRIALVCALSGLVCLGARAQSADATPLAPNPDAAQSSGAVSPDQTNAAQPAPRTRQQRQQLRHDRQALKQDRETLKQDREQLQSDMQQYGAKSEQVATDRQNLAQERRNVAADEANLRRDTQASPNTSPNAGANTQVQPAAPADAAPDGSGGSQPTQQQ